MELIVLGRGRLGTSLAVAAVAAGHHAALFPGRTRPAELSATLRASRRVLVFLALPNPSLPAAAASLAALAPAPEAAFLHVSGALDLEVLAPLAARGHDVGSFHPLQSFPQPRPPAAFKGSLIAIEHSSDALGEDLEQLARDLGGRPRLVPRAQRTRYHAAAVMASNYLVALADQATGLLVKSGWEQDQALAAIVPLLRGAIDNLEEHGSAGALIGPIRRGDPETVSRHLAALAGDPVATDVYRSLGRAALELAVEAGLGPNAESKIGDVLASRCR